MIEIFTDGASSGNPGPGGYGVILRSGKYYKELAEGFRKTTNNRMELLAVIKGFKDKKNKDLWLRYLEVSKLHNIKFTWVRGHNGHPENERCDELAVAAGKQKPLLIDSVFEMENAKAGLL